MPEDIPGGDMSSCMEIMQEDGHDEDSAARICEALSQEAKSDQGNAEALLNAIESGSGLIADVGVDLVSGVDVPAVDSKWVMTKSGDDRKGHDYRARSPILLSKADDDSSEKRIAYAAAMIPREPDKEGDVVATPTVEKAAHDFLKQDGGVDTDHSLIDGDGEVVESWVLKEERTFDLPGGETETYGAGTWMVGIEWAADAWDRIKAGDLTGLSIYGQAEHVPLARSVDASGKGCAELAAELEDLRRRIEDTREHDGNGDTHKKGATESADMAPDNSGDGGGDASGDGTSTDDGPTLKDLREDINTLTESVEETVKEAVETAKQDEQEAAAMLGEAYGMQAGDVLDILQIAEGKDLEDVFDALDSIDAGGDGEVEEAAEEKEDGEYDDEDDEEKSVEKRAGEANLSKGGDATGTAQKGITGDADATSGVPSFKQVAEQAEAEE